MNVVTPLNELNEEKIVSGIKNGDVRDIIQTTGIDGRNSIKIYNSNCTGTASGNETGGVVYPSGKIKRNSGTRRYSKNRYKRVLCSKT